MIAKFEYLIKHTCVTAWPLQFSFDPWKLIQKETVTLTAKIADLFPSSSIITDYKAYSNLLVFRWAISVLEHERCNLRFIRACPPLYPPSLAVPIIVATTAKNSSTQWRRG